MSSDSDESFYITQSSPKRLVENVQEQPSKSHESRLIFILFMFVITLIHIVKHSSICVAKRFRDPITSFECEAFEKSWISDASRKKWAWALRAFEEWRRERNLAISKDGDSVEQKLHSSLEEMSDDHLDHFLARFVAEVRKVDGKEYPGKTI